MGKDPAVAATATEAVSSETKAAAVEEAEIEEVEAQRVAEAFFYKYCFEMNESQEQRDERARFTVKEEAAFKVVVKEHWQAAKPIYEQYPLEELAQKKDVSAVIPVNVSTPATRAHMNNHAIVEGRPKKRKRQQPKKAPENVHTKSNTKKQKKERKN